LSLRPDYFSTFGGGTAACAAAIAVLRTIEEAHLVARVSETGARLVTALRDGTAEDPQVGDVRGWGLAVAVDIVDPATGRFDQERTTRIIEGMRDRGVLIGRTGRERAHLEDPAPAGLRRRPRQTCSSMRWRSPFGAGRMTSFRPA
jgi:4-aminobutyrate aminotransferase-like enzyme